MHRLTALALLLTLWLGALAQAPVPGQPAPRFSLPDTQGKTVTPADFKGQYLLIDFWASWCRDCRKENPALVQLARKYSGRNLAVLGVSLDKERERWTDCIAKDSLFWTQVSDLSGWDSPAAKAYDIHWIPTSVLVGPDGNIIAVEKSLEPINEKLEQIFK